MSTPLIHKASSKLAAGESAPIQTVQRRALGDITNKTPAPAQKQIGKTGNIMNTVTKPVDVSSTTKPTMKNPLSVSKAPQSKMAPQIQIQSAQSALAPVEKVKFDDNDADVEYTYCGPSSAINIETIASRNSNINLDFSDSDIKAALSSSKWNSFKDMHSKNFDDDQDLEYVDINVVNSSSAKNGKNGIEDGSSMLNDIDGDLIVDLDLGDVDFSQLTL
jgi:hypothetical protein